MVAQYPTTHISKKSHCPSSTNLQSPLERLEAAVALADAFKEQIGERRDPDPARAVMQKEG